MSVKKPKVEIQKIPYDCWCNVISFLGDTRDFFSVVLTVSGLYDYIRNIFPSCTSNMTVRIRRIKKVCNSCSHFSSVSYLTEKTNATLEFGSIGGFFSNIVEKFSNVKKLFLVLNRSFCKELPNEFTIGREVPSLVYFFLHIHRSKKSENDSVFFNPTFPLSNLKVLGIFISSGRRRRVTIEPRSKLEIRNVSHIKNVEVLKLEGWKLTSKYSEILKLENLKHLELRNSLTEEINCSTVFSTKYLYLTESSVSNFQDFNLPQVEKLLFIRSLAYRRFKLSDLGLESYSELPNLQLKFTFSNVMNLKILVIEIDGPFEYGFQNDFNMFKISENTFPQLENVRLITNKDNENTFTVSIGQSNKLKTIYVRNWKEADLLNEKCLRNVESLRFFNREMSLENDIIFKSLVEFDAYRDCLKCAIFRRTDELEPWEEPPADMTVSFIGFKVLKVLDFDLCKVDEISDCPNLHFVNFFPSKRFKCSHNSTNEEVVASPSDKSCLTSTINFFLLPLSRSQEQPILENLCQSLRSWGENNTIKCYSFFFLEKPKLSLSGDIHFFNTDLRHVTNIIFLFKRDRETHKTLDIHLSDFFFIELVEIDILENPYPQYLCLKNFPRLKSLNLGSRFTANTEEISFSRLHLEDLPMCETFIVGQGFTSIHDIHIKNFGVRKLIVIFGSKDDQKMYFRSKMRICGQHFPQLERINVDFVGEDVDFSIGVMENLQYLRFIKLDRKDHHMKPFVRSIRGFDLEKVTVECHFVEMFGTPGYWENGVKYMKLSLKDYVVRMNQKNDEKIFVNQ